MTAAETITMHCPHACLSPCSTCEASKAARDLRALREALTLAICENVKRCWECDAPASWHEVGWSGQDKFWCEEHVEIPQRAISKGAGRYQPQRIKRPHWLDVAMSTLEEAGGPCGTSPKGGGE